MDDAADLRSALDVVAQALLSRSEAEASARITAAEERAKDIVAEGLAHAEDITRSAEAEGTRSAESEAGHRLARGRRKARRAVLGARMVAMERLHAETLAAVPVQITRLSAACIIPKAAKRTKETPLLTMRTVVSNTLTTASVVPMLPPPAPL